MNTYSMDNQPAGALAVRALYHVPYGVVLVDATLKTILYSESAAQRIAASDGNTLSKRYLIIREWGVESVGNWVDSESCRTEVGDICGIVL